MIRLYRTEATVVADVDGELADLGPLPWDEIVSRDGLARWVRTRATLPWSGSLPPRLLPPIGTQEVWAAGVTYLRSRAARMEESGTSGAADVYARVYDAPRPEIFFKATPHRVVGHGQPVRLRDDARWLVPEPELALVLDPQGRLSGYTIGNDVSARDLEGENPLYLPQAKIWDGSCALGPCLLLAEDPLPASTEIVLDVRRRGAVVAGGGTTLSRMKRTFEELARCLYHACSFPAGAVLLTGTGIVPDAAFTLEPGDEVRITIAPIGTLVNVVAG